MRPAERPHRRGDADDEVSGAMAPQLPKLSSLDAARVLSGVVLPLFGRGLLARRPPIVSLLELLDADHRAVRALQRLDARYGPGPLLLRLAGRRYALILDPADAQRVLWETPDPFSPETVEKAHALAQFQPEGVLNSRGEERRERRRFNEDVLDSPSPVHEYADALLPKIVEEGHALRSLADERGVLTWEMFIESWYRAVRRVVLGDAAADDHLITDALGRLRARANWSVMKPTDTRLREAFLHRLGRYVERAEEGSLAHRVASVPHSERTAAVQQLPQWLFAFDPAGMATYRALALLATHPTHAAAAQSEVTSLPAGVAAGDGPLAEYPLLRASVLESLRLWPTTPAILRECTDDVQWDTGTLPRGAGVLIFAPYFHRDDRRLSEADTFSPGLWTDGDHSDAVLVPFSAGHAVCPGRNIVLMLTSTMLATLLEGRRYVQSGGRRLSPDHPLPSVLDPFRLAFDVHDAPSQASR